MKWIFKRCLLAAPAIIFYSLLICFACLVTGCKQKQPILSVYNSTDSSGPGGSPKVLSIRTSGIIPAGSTVVLGCDSPGCKLASLSSTDTTGHTGGVKLLNLGTIPVDIPDNTELELRIIPKGDSAAGMGK